MSNATRRSLNEWSTLQDEVRRIYEWRIEQFEAIGWDDTAAEALASSDADLGEARALVAAGCTLPVAFQILL